MSQAETSDAPKSDENIASEAPAKVRKDRWSWLIVLTGVGSLLAYLVAGLGTQIGAWDYPVGLSVVPFALLAAVVALLLFVVDVVRARKKKRGLAWGKVLLGVAGSVILLVMLLPYVFAGLSKPAIHDISTDLADPPEFAALELREDNWDNIPGEDDSDYRGLTPRQRWARIHQDAYPDIRSVRIDEPVATVVARAERLAEDRGWDIELAAPKNGRLEATDTVSIFGFKDDVVLRARPVEGGKASIVDVRSVSRVGVGDLGVNAERIESFLGDLSGTVGTSVN